MGSVMGNVKSLREGPEGTHISALHPEILEHIFTFLDVADKGTAAQVCVAWRDACYFKSLWRGVEARLCFPRHHIPPTLFESIAERGIRRVRALPSDRCLGDIVKGIPNLEALNISRCYKVKDSGILNAFSTPHNSLTELNLSFCVRITDASLYLIGGNLKKLKILVLADCRGITNYGLLYVARGLKHLKQLNLKGCSNISDRGISFVAGRNTGGAEGNLALEELVLHGCQGVTDGGLSTISVALTALKSLNLCSCRTITDHGLQFLGKMPSLRKLNLQECEISEEGMANLAAGGSRIAILILSCCTGIGDHGLWHLSRGLVHLEHLCLYGCNVTDLGVRYIAKSLRKLVLLNLGSNRRITDRSLQAITANLPGMECLYVYGCPRLTASYINRLAFVINEPI